MSYADDPQDNPYAAPKEAMAPLSEVGPPQGFTSYAGFWLRFVAYIIDSIVGGVIGMVVGMPFGIVTGIMGGGQPTEPGQGPAPAQMAVIGLMYAVLIAVSIGYYAGMESSKYQATLGKMALGLKVTDLYGRRISFGRAVGRLFAKIISAIPCYIGFIMAGFTQKKQALHDMIAGTLVVKP